MNALAKIFQTVAMIGLILTSIISIVLPYDPDLQSELLYIQLKLLVIGYYSIMAFVIPNLKMKK